MKKKLINVVIVGLCLTILTGCKKTIPQEENTKLDIPSNIVIKLDNNIVGYYTIENTILKKVDLDNLGEIRGVNEEKDIVISSTFNTASYSTTLTITNGIDVENIEVKGFVENLLVNPTGTKIFYKVVEDNEFIRYETLDIDTLEIQVLKEDLIISGDLIDFIDENNIIVYGVDINEKKSGLYKVNITNSEFKLINQISNAFIDYVKIVDNNKILFIQSSVDDGKKTYIYKIDEGKLDLITDKIKRVSEVCFNEEIIYFTGELVDNRFSLYSLDLKSNEIKRLIYDFPKEVVEESKLIFQDNKVFFVGYEADEYNSNIYFYDILSKSTRVFDEKDSQYRIIKEDR